jgi:putative colanic acid biosynthesis UDP-glucose lipid carrier transferase
MKINNIPLISFRRIIDPIIVMGTLYLCSVFFSEPTTGYLLVLMVLAFFISSSVYGAVDPYHTWRKGRMLAYARDVFVGWGITAAILALLGWASSMAVHYDANMVVAWFIATPFALLSIHLASRAIALSPAHDRDMRSVVVIGANSLSVKFVSTVAKNPALQMDVQGYFDDRTKDRWPQNLNKPILGDMTDIAHYVRTHNVKMIFISQPLSAQPRIRKLLDELQDTTASVYFLPDIYTIDLMHARFDNVGGMPVIAIRETPFTGLNSMIKRISDIILAIVIQILLLPLMVVIAVAVKVTSPGPVIFRQRRYGLYGDEITVYKFRTMTSLDNGDTIVQAQKNDKRLTKIGHFLRRTSLDELPQFFNVLQGRMSIVGPRPHAVAHNEQYRKLIKGYMLRHKVKPGITGWAQVNGLRGETETLDKMEARIQYDLEYLRGWSLWLDLWIIARTVQVVLKRENAH